MINCTTSESRLNMPYKPTSAGSEPVQKGGGGLSGRDRQQGALQDRRGGTRDTVMAPRTQPLKEHRTEHENAQPGADVRSDTEYSSEATPERLRRMETNMVDDKKDEKSNSTTNEPWKKPGQTSQDESQQPTPNVVEQEKGKKGIR
jgi:hypothetical protein